MMIAPSSRHPSTHGSRSLPAQPWFFYSRLTANHRSTTVPYQVLVARKVKEKREKQKQKAIPQRPSHETFTAPYHHLAAQTRSSPRVLRSCRMRSTLELPCPCQSQDGIATSRISFAKVHTSPAWRKNQATLFGGRTYSLNRIPLFRGDRNLLSSRRQRRSFIVGVFTKQLQECIRVLADQSSELWVS